MRRGICYQEQLKRKNKINIWGTFTENAQNFSDRECIWYSDPGTNPPTTYSYTWQEAYSYACQHAQWFLDAGIRPGQCVGLYLQNSPELVLGWMGLLAIGCWPAMINYNLIGDALVHCVKVADCQLLLVDEDLQRRVLDNEQLEAMVVKVQVLDQPFKDRLRQLRAETPDPIYTKDANEKTKLAMRYTR